MTHSRTDEAVGFMRKLSVVVAAPVSLVAPLVLLVGTAHAATPVAVWSMESAAAMTDSSGNGNNGTTSAIATVPDPGFGNGYRFGPTSSVTVPDSDLLDPGTADFSFTARVRFDDPPSATTVDYDLIRKGISSTPGGEWKMEIFPGSGYNSPAFCLFKDSTKKTATLRGTKNLADGAWHTITCTKTAKTVSLTVDGATRSLAVSLGSISNNQPVSVGRKLGGGDQYVGDLDEVRVEVGSTSTPADTTPPTATTVPASGATSVAVNADVTATFNEPVQGVSGTTFKLRPAGSSTAVSATVTYNATTHVGTLNPASNLVAGAQYTATLTGGATAIRDTAGNPMASTSWSFTTAAAAADTTAPTATTVPAGGATGVAANAPVTATFSEPVQGVSESTFTLTPAAGGAALAATVSQGTGNQWILDPLADLTAGASYAATLTGGVSAIRDLAGNPLVGKTWNFTVAGGGADTVAPTVTAVAPPNGRTGVSRIANVTVAFSEPVTNVTTTTFSLTPAAGGSAVTAVVKFNSTSGRWVLNPGVTLAANTLYRATITSGVTDLDSPPNTFAGTSWTFKTGA